jgi:hypothetical protein
MIRLVNQFDSSEHLPSTMVASGGANCSTCSSSCSCIVTAVVASVVSARMVPKLLEAGSTTPKLVMQRRVISAAIIPLIILSLFLSIALDGNPAVLALSVIMYIGYLAVITRGTARPKKFILLHILLIVAWLAVSVLEMIGWMQFR